MQKTKSLLVKILVFMCVICCSVALMLGLTGCAKDGLNGEPGAPGVDGISIESAEVDADGNLIITLTNGNKINAGNVVGPIGPQGPEGEDGEDATPVECEHTFYEIQTEEATCQKEGVKVKICTKDGGCGHAYVEKTAINPNNHVDFDVTTVDATCTAEGYTSKVCACGYETGKTNIVPALGHNYSSVTTQPTCEDDGYITDTCSRCGDVKITAATAANGLLATGHDAVGTWVTVVDENANICEDGGQRLLVCMTCFTSCTDCEGMIYEAEEIVAEGHNVTSAWTTSVAPTKDTAGSIAGYCDVCGTNATVALPALNKTDYAWAETIPAQCDAEGTDTYTITIKGVSFSYEVTTTTAHLYNGVKMPLDKVYTPAEVETVFGNAPATCKDHSGKGSFTCDSCNEEWLVSVSGDHEYTEADLIDTVAPTCTAMGSKTYKCPVCEEEIVVSVDMVDHSYGVPSFDPTTKKLTFTCTVCGGTEVLDCDADPTVTTVEATCTTPGKTTYSYTYNGGTPGTFEVEHSIISHYFGSKTNSVNINKEVPYTLTELKDIFGDALTGLTTYGNSPTDCSTTGSGSFICSGCHTPYLIDITGDHAWVAGDTVAPTCTADGYTNYTCSINAAHKTTGNIVSATGHSYNLSNEKSDFANGVLVFVCANNCGVDKTINADTFEVKTQAATCSAEGKRYVLYTYTVDGVTYADQEEVLEVLPKNNDHTVNGGNIINPNNKYTIAQLKDIFGDALTGLTTYGNSPSDCVTEGQASFHCSVCNQDYLFTMTGDHSFSAWTKVDATCTEGAYEYRDCSVCSKHEVNVLVAEPATGHTFEFAVVGATESAAGSLTITCEDCDYEEVIVLPALSAANGYVVSVDVPNSCASEGVTTYTIVVEYADSLLYTYTTSVITPVIDHVDAEPPVETTWVYNGYTYTGYYCGSCNQMIVTSKTEITE